MFARWSDGPSPRRVVGVIALIAGLALGAALPAAAATPATNVTVDAHHPGRQIPAQFLGLGFEYKTLVRYAGVGSGPANPVLDQLIANVAPGQSPILRIGGDTTDWSWWPVAGMPPPPPISDAISPQWLTAYRQIQRKLGARLILGVNLQTDSKVVADTEARALLRGLGSTAVQALELGNEPELYTSFGYSRAADGSLVATRVPNWSFAQFQRGFSSIASSLPAVPLAGPAMGDEGWNGEFGRFLTAEPRVKLATAHRYPMSTCSKPRSVEFPSQLKTLSAYASGEPAASLRGFVRLAHHHHVPLRVDEMNITPCPERAGELRRSLSTALWATDVLFELVNVGVDGVNVQSTTGGTDDLFSFDQSGPSWRANVAPEYYGLLLFAHTAPAGSRLIELRQVPRPPLHIWATLTATGVVRVVMINDGAAVRRLAVTVLGGIGPATLERLRGRIHGGGQVSLGGQSFGAWTSTGVLGGRSRLGLVRPTGESYGTSLPGYSAALLTVSLH
jgi:hypothetical protein